MNRALTISCNIYDTPQGPWEICQIVEVRCKRAPFRSELASVARRHARDVDLRFSLTSHLDFFQGNYHPVLVGNTAEGFHGDRHVVSGEWCWGAKMRKYGLCTLTPSAWQPASEANKTACIFFPLCWGIIKYEYYLNSQLVQDAAIELLACSCSVLT